MVMRHVRIGAEASNRTFAHRPLRSGTFLFHVVVRHIRVRGLAFGTNSKADNEYCFSFMPILERCDRGSNHDCSLGMSALSPAPNRAFSGKLPGLQAPRLDRSCSSKIVVVVAVVDCRCMNGDLFLFASSAAERATTIFTSSRWDTADTCR